MCRRGSVFDTNVGVVPGVAFGPKIEGLPDDVADAYAEARRCLSAECNTAAEGMCRKILMHIAVDKKAKEGGSFASYIDYLAISEFPKWSKYLILLSFQDNSSARSVQIGGWM